MNTSLSPSPLRLRALTPSQTRVSQQLAEGCRFAFSFDDGRQGELRLSLASLRESKPPARVWQSAAGCFSLSDPTPALSLMSDCPALLPTQEDDPTAAAWFWALFNHALSPQLYTLLGPLTPVNGDIAADAIPLWLDVQVAARRARSLLCMAGSELLSLLRQPGWFSSVFPLPQTLPISMPLTLAEVTLSPRQVYALEPGDLIYPPTCSFSPQGDGLISVGGRRFRGQLQWSGLTPTHFIIAEQEECPVNDAFEFSSPHDMPFADEMATTATADDAPLPALPLTLTVRCGHLSLTLQALQQLACGSVVPVQQTLPGEAMLYHGEVPLARGELVEVAGRLGLQITQRLGALQPDREPMS
ncbi:FliM/FliN family flagellar motor switch protein [Lonsdalea quercina]|uniref:FliM/FliN family flagellar motor switch protein n=1 Tax=Lonsdalea quercina TaxID=71657 RepID=UPI0039756998